MLGYARVWCGGVGYSNEGRGLWNILGGHFMLGRGSYIKECESRHGRVG